MDVSAPIRAAQFKIPSRARSAAAADIAVDDIGRTVIVALKFDIAGRMVSPDNDVGERPVALIRVNRSWVSSNCRVFAEGDIKALN